MNCLTKNDSLSRSVDGLPQPTNTAERQYLAALRQAETAAWEAMMPKATPLVAAPARVKAKPPPGLPRPAPEEKAENWLFKGLALVATGAAVWACWDSTGFFTRWPQFVQFVQNLVQ